MPELSNAYLHSYIFYHNLAAGLYNAGFDSLVWKLRKAEVELGLSYSSQTRITCSI